MKNNSEESTDDKVGEISTLTALTNQPIDWIEQLKTNQKESTTEKT